MYDYAVCTHEMQHLVEEVHTCYDPPISTHCAVVYHMHVHMHKIQTRQMVKPKPLITKDNEKQGAVGDTSTAKPWHEVQSIIAANEIKCNRAIDEGSYAYA